MNHRRDYLHHEIHTTPPPPHTPQYKPDVSDQYDNIVLTGDVDIFTDWRTEGYLAFLKSLIMLGRLWALCWVRSGQNWTKNNSLKETFLADNAEHLTLTVWLLMSWCGDAARSGRFILLWISPSWTQWSYEIIKLCLIILSDHHRLEHDLSPWNWAKLTGRTYHWSRERAGRWGVGWSNINEISMINMFIISEGNW